MGLVRVGPGIPRHKQITPLPGAIRLCQGVGTGPAPAWDEHACLVTGTVNRSGFSCSNDPAGAARYLMSFIADCPLIAAVPCQAAFAWPGCAPHAPGAPRFLRRLRPKLARWQAALKDKGDWEVSLSGHGDSDAGGEVVESGTGEVEQDSFDERLSVLTPDAVGRAGHALTDEERGRGRAVVGSARLVGGTDWTPPDEGTRTAGVR